MKGLVYPLWQTACLAVVTNGVIHSHTPLAIGCAMIVSGCFGWSWGIYFMEKIYRL